MYKQNLCHFIKIHRHSSDIAIKLNSNHDEIAAGCWASARKMAVEFATQTHLCKWAFRRIFHLNLWYKKCLNKVEQTTSISNCSGNVESILRSDKKYDGF